MFTRRIFLSGLLGAALLSRDAQRRHSVGAQRPRSSGSATRRAARSWSSPSSAQVLEKRLKEVGVENVKWVEFQFGPPLLEALGAGAVDIGVVGDTPPIFAQAAKANLVYVASTPASASAILVPKDSPIQQRRRPEGQEGRHRQGIEFAQSDHPGAGEARPVLRRHRAGLSRARRRRRRLLARAASTPGQSGIPTSPSPRTSTMPASWSTRPTRPLRAIPSISPTGISRRTIRTC